MKNEKLKKGFTLIEIMVVIGIMAVLGSVSWAGFVKYQPSLALSAVSRDLVSDLRLSQQLSVTEQINHGIFISISTNEYQLKKFAGTTETLFSKHLPSGISFCEITGLSEGYAIFNPYGSTAFPGVVCLVNIKGQIEKIEIKPSGFVKIQN
mgnify:CR=1 FL=1